LKGEKKPRERVVTSYHQIFEANSEDLGNRGIKEPLSCPGKQQTGVVVHEEGKRGKGRLSPKQPWKENKPKREERGRASLQLRGKKKKDTGTGVIFGKDSRD